MIKKSIFLLAICTSTFLSGQISQTKVLAHWKFDPAHKKSGTIKDGNLILKDLSGNSNDLEFKVLKMNKSKGHGEEVNPKTLTASQKEKLATAFEWKSDSYGNNSSAKNLLFKEGGRKEFWDLSGYFQTSEKASLNTKTFEKGYTIEVIFKMPKKFTSGKHRWSAIFNRHGSARQLGQKTKKNYVGGDAGSTIANLNISSLRELQWTHYSTKPQKGGHFDNQTCWSFTLEDSEWYKVVLINDTKSTKLYVNGVTDFRNVDPKKYPQDGGIEKTIASKFGWDIGAKGDTFKDENKDGVGEYKIKRIFNGQIQEVRFTEGALPKEKWLYNDVKQNSFTKIGTNKNVPLLKKAENYNLVLVPDTQKPIRYKPEIVTEQMKWIVENSKNKNVAFTAFLGDLVDQFQQKKEWQNIDNAVKLLDNAKIPYLTTDGNHDGIGFSSPTASMGFYTYLDYFGEKRYKGKPYYYNESPSKYSPFSLFRGKDYTYLILALPYFNPPYANDLGGQEYFTKGKKGYYDKILEKYSYLPTIIITHEHLKIKKDGTGVERAKRVNGTGTFARNNWTQIITKNNQIFMVFNGHHHGVGYQISKNNKGSNVLEAVFDYQSAYQGGNGWMNFAEFNEADNKVDFKVFSPWVDKIPANKREYYDVKHLTRPGEMFTFNINFKERFKFYPKLSFTKGTSGSSNNQISIDYDLSKEIPGAYIGIFKKGEKVSSANAVVKKNISGKKGSINVSIVKKGEYFATLMVKGLNVQVSNNLPLIVDKSLSTESVKATTHGILYPNPFNRSITLDSNADTDKIVIFDMIGSKVIEKKVTTSKTVINTERLQKGVYIISIYDKKGNKTSQKIIKE